MGEHDFELSHVNISCILLIHLAWLLVSRACEGFIILHILLPLLLQVITSLIFENGELASA